MNNTAFHPGIKFAMLAMVFIACLALAAWSGYYILIILPFVFLLCYAGWMDPQLVFYGLLISIPFSFEYQVAEQWGTDIPDELLMILSSFLFLAYFLYRPAGTGKIISHPLVLLVAAWMMWMVLCAIFSTNPLISAKFLLAKSWYLGAFLLAPLVVLRDRSSFGAVALTLAGSMMLVVTIIMIRHAGKGFTFATINEAVIPFFRNHVNYSALLVCSIPILAACWYHSKTRTGRILLMLLTFFSITALFFSYSRGAWLALIAGIITVWLLKKRLLVVSFCMLLLLSIAAMFWLKKDERYLQYAHDYRSTIFHPDFNEHLVATYQLKDVSTAERFYRWIAAVNMIRENRVTGFGPGTFYDNYKPYGIPAYRTWVSDNPDRSTAHNYFLLVAVEQGLPGLAIFLAIVFAVLWYAQRLYITATDPFYRVVALVTASIFVMLLVLNSLSDLVETDKAGSLFFLCVAVLVAVKSKIETQKSKVLNEK